MESAFRRAVFPGSFNPIHYGHLDIVRRAARVFDEVIIAVYDNPMGKELIFNLTERVALVKAALVSAEDGFEDAFTNVKVASFSGLAVDYVASVDSFILIRGLRVFSDFEFEFRMALANQRLAPDIEMVNFMTGEKYIHISSSTVREVAMLGGDVSSMVPPNVMQALYERYGTSQPKRRDSKWRPVG